MATPTTNPGMDLRELLDSGKRVFSSYPQVAHYFPSTTMEDARRRTTRAIDRGDGPALVIGAAGTGKSLLLQTLAAHYHQRFDVVLLACARLCTRRALLQTILFELGLPHRQRDEGQLRLSLLDHLLSESQCPAGLLLLVDEAQSLSIPLLDELRVMTNLMHSGSPRVRLVLAGSSALEESFADPGLESFSQRLSARCYLAPMNREETAQLVRTQLAAAGADAERVFALDAYDATFEASDGVPRLINQVCDRALVMAADESLAVVDRRTIQAAWADLQQLPTAWQSPHESSDSPVEAAQVIEFGSLHDEAVESGEEAIIEPTELDLDDDEDSADDNAQSQQPPRIDTTVAPIDCTRRVARDPRDPENPFAEEFDEEEVVLDDFASWDDIIHAGTPRVENRRDPGIATLVQTALEESTPVELLELRRESERDDSSAEDDQSDATQPGEEPASLEDLPPDWPRLRLADVPEPPDTEQISVNADQAPIDSDARPWGDPSGNTERPILIIDDEGAPPIDAGPPVRRLAYQHLFSRLRSG
jgi:type II secretory pathway predicted ATPase ExeA